MMPVSDDEISGLTYLIDITMRRLVLLLRVRGAGRAAGMDRGVGLVRPPLVCHTLFVLYIWYRTLLCGILLVVIGVWWCVGGWGLFPSWYSPLCCPLLGELLAWIVGWDW
jgi:hypothetical protein